MKKLVFLIAIVAAVSYYYQNHKTPDAATVAATAQGLTTLESDVPEYRNGPAPTASEDKSGLPPSLDVEVSDGRDAVTPGAGDAQGKNRRACIGGCKVYDESGSVVEFGDVLARSSGGVLLLHVGSAAREGSPGAGDKAYFKALSDLQGCYGDKVAVVGLSLSGSLDQVRELKSCCGVSCDVLSMPKAAESMLENDRRKAFFDAIGAGGGNPAGAPSTIFIKDGKYVVKHLAGPSSYKELEAALLESMKL